MSRNESWDGLGSNKTAIHDNVANEISAVTLKATPVAADEALIEDSAASYVKKSMTLGTIPTAGDVTGTLAAALVTAVTLTENSAFNLQFKEATTGNVYTEYRTDTGNERITLGNATDNPDIYFLGAGEWQFGASAGTLGNVLTSNGAAASPTWTSGSAIAIAGDVTGTLAASVVEDFTLGSDATGDLALRDASNWNVLAIGANNEVLTSNGTTATWAAAAAGGLTIFTEAEADGTQASTVLSTVTANDNIVLNPGTGAIMAGPAPDALSPGGLSRGQWAVDFQISRASNDHIASGQSAGLLAGSGNSASATSAAVVGGSGCHAQANYASVIGGTTILAQAINCVVAGGLTQTISSAGSYAGIFAGLQGSTSGVASVNLGGQGNVNTTGDHAAIVGGQNSDVAAGGNFSVILGGQHSNTTAAGALAAGYSALADHPTAFALSGSNQAAADAQRGESQMQFVHMDGSTTNATPTVMYSQGSVELAVPNNTCFGITGKLCAWNETDEKLTTWAIDLDCYSADGTSVTFLGGNGNIPVKAKDDTGDCVFGITNTSGNINFDITGIASKVIRWSLRLNIARAAT